MKILMIIMRNNKDMFVYDPCDSENRYNPVVQLGIPYIAAYLKREGFDVAGLNLNDEPGTIRDVMKKHLSENTYDMIFTCGTSLFYHNCKDLIKIIREFSGAKIVVGGGLVSAKPQMMMKLLKPDFIIRYEGEVTAAELARAVRDGTPLSSVDGICYKVDDNIIATPPRKMIKDLDLLPYPDFDTFGFSRQIEEFKPLYIAYDHTDKPRPYSIIASRGCPFACLHGDTPIDTTTGTFKIRDLVGTTPKVLTRDPVTKEPLYAQTTIVAKTGENRKLVRVAFREGGHIDCTTDHKFVVFKNSNQYTDLREYEVEAKDLKVGNSVRAIHYQKGGPMGYEYISWGRRSQIQKHRLIMESLLGKKLSRDDFVHHKDHDPMNNVESNLELTNAHDHISILHPEMSQRMKDDNPAKYLPHEHFVQLGKAQLGKVRSMESRLNYKASKTGDKNPNWKGGHSRTVKSRIPGQPDVNHVVDSVTPLEGLHDTYCMEVPGYDWFYANDVLVDNCTFCFHTIGKGYRKRSVDNVIDEIKYAIEKYKANVIFFNDELFSYDKPRTLELCQKIKEIKDQTPWEITVMANNRVDKIDDEILDAVCYDMGCNIVGFGLESFSDTILKSMKKHITSDQIRKAIKGVSDRKCVVQGSFIFGDSAETLETAQETLDYYLQNQDVIKNAAQVTFIMAFPGAPIYEEAVRRGIIKDEENFIENKAATTYNRLTPLNLTDMSDADFEILKNRVFTAEYISHRSTIPDWVEPGKISAICPYCGERNNYFGISYPSFVGCRHCNGRYRLAKWWYKPSQWLVRVFGFNAMNKLREMFQ